jgi:hypothetical protein
MTETLAEKTCTPCRGGIPPLTRDETQRLQAQAPDWQLADDRQSFTDASEHENCRPLLQSEGHVALVYKADDDSWIECIGIEDLLLATQAVLSQTLAIT